jgi:hypothetical protein
MVSMDEQPPPLEPLWKGLDEATIEEFHINYKVNEKLIYFYRPIIFMSTIARPPLTRVATMASITVSRLP